MKRVAVSVLVMLAGCGEIAGITELTSDQAPDAGVAPVVDAGSEVAVADVVADTAPPIDATEADKGFRRIFVTSLRWDGKELGGIAGADQKCADMAAPNGLLANGEQWFAFLGAGAVSAKDRLTFDGPYRLLNGTEIAQNKAKFTSGSLLHAIDVNEKGNPPTDEMRVWTGMESNGNISANTCSGWLNDTVFGLFGRVDTSGAGWTASGSTACGVQLRLYCIER